MHGEITVETDLFEHREVRPHFINPCCFGEDFVLWLRRQLEPLAGEGYIVSDAIQEDYGWGVWVSHARDRFWIALSFCGDGPQEPPPHWIVSVSQDKRAFHNPDGQAFEQLRGQIWQSIRANPAMRIISE